MRNFWTGVGTTILIFLFGWFLVSQNLFPLVGQKRTITVVGEGKVKIKPEVAQLNVGVTNIAGNVTEAMTQNQQAIDSVLAVLRNLGISQEDIRTSSYSVWPQQSQYYEDGIQKSKITGYQVSNSLSVDVHNTDQVSQVLAKVLESGATDIGGIYFTAEDPKEPAKEARIKAIEDAQVKATSMAQASKKGLGRLISLSEGTSVSLSPLPVMYGGAGGGGGPSIEPGKLEIAQTVTAIYELK